MPLPPGDLTFLFTDIEGSTRLWETDPAAMRATLDWHDSVLQATFDAHGGRVFKRVGDACCAVFESPDAAAAAALEAQRALLQRLKVRIALHAGPAERRDDDFFGPTLNRIARLLATGHGGQILLSDAARQALESLPPDASAADLGLHGLKDLQRPERVWQLRHPDLPADFPPLHSLQVRLHNLPTQLTSFIGREAEMASVRDLLDGARLLTVTGSGGCGKTRLALQVAADRFDAFPDGVWLVELAPIQDPSLVLAAVAGALQVREKAGQSLLQSLLEFAADKHFLLIVDNCEHLIEAVASLVGAMLRAGSRLRVLATSREPLGLVGERTYRVPSLALPEPDQGLALESLPRFDGLRLFLERAAAVAPTFVATRENASALVAVCRRLDGIPLAIELAAARVRALPVEQLAARLDDRFRLLTSGSRTALPRQQTLRALVDWSYNLLDPREQALLRRLSVFVGGWTLEAAEAVCAGEDTAEWEVVDLLTSLVDKSLVAYEEDATRYRLLETVRYYAAERLADEGAEPVQARHHACYLTLARTAEPELMGADQRLWLDRLDAERDNLRAALDHCLRGRDSAAALALCLCLERFWYMRGRWSEGRRYFEATLALESEPDQEADRALAIHCLGLLAYGQGDWEAADGYLKRAVERYEALQLHGRIPVLLGHLGVMAIYREAYDEARAHLDQSLRMQRDAGRVDGVAAILLNLGELERRLGALDAARAHFEESLALWTELGHWHPVAIVHNNLSRIACAQGRFSDAWALAREALRVRGELQDRQGIVLSLEAMAAIASAQGRSAEVLTLLSASLGLQQSAGLILSAQEQAEHQERADAARADLSPEDAAAAEASGAALDSERAVAFGLRLSAPEQDGGSRSPDAG